MDLVAGSRITHCNEKSGAPKLTVEEVAKKTGTKGSGP